METNRLVNHTHESRFLITKQTTKSIIRLRKEIHMAESVTKAPLLFSQRKSILAMNELLPTRHHSYSSTPLESSNAPSGITTTTSYTFGKMPTKLFFGRSISQPLIKIRWAGVIPEDTHYNSDQDDEESDISDSETEEESNL